MLKLLRRPLHRPALIARALYGRIRPFLPDADPVRYAGLIGPHHRKLFDRQLTALVPDWRPDVPDYEEALVRGLRQVVRAGDHVVVVGGGFGITAALAALLAGSDGRVTCFEGNNASLADIRLTALGNGVADRLEARAAIVGEAIGVYGDTPAELLPAGLLPACDVLELDCEGAERGILDAMTIRPRAIVVETHGMAGSPSAGVWRQLEALGYAVSDLGVAEPRMQAFCEQQDVRVLLGTRD